MEGYFPQPEFPKLAGAPYGQRLRHPKWQRRRLEALLLANWRCSKCGDTETPLEVHHISYRPGAEPWEYDLNELRVLCERCHEFEHVSVSAEGCCYGECAASSTESTRHSRQCGCNQASCSRYRRLAAILSSMDTPVKRRLQWLNDHKGILTASWRFRPSRADRDHLAHLWATVGQEDACAVQHTIGDGSSGATS